MLTFKLEKCKTGMKLEHHHLTATAMMNGHHKKPHFSIFITTTLYFHLHWYEIRFLKPPKFL